MVPALAVRHTDDLIRLIFRTQDQALQIYSRVRVEVAALAIIQWLDYPSGLQDIFYSDKRPAIGYIKLIAMMRHLRGAGA